MGICFIGERNFENFILEVILKHSLYINGQIDRQADRQTHTNIMCLILVSNSSSIDKTSTSYKQHIRLICRIKKKKRNRILKSMCGAEIEMCLYKYKSCGGVKRKRMVCYL